VSKLRQNPLTESTRTTRRTASNWQHVKSRFWSNLFHVSDMHANW